MSAVRLTEMSTLERVQLQRDKCNSAGTKFAVHLWEVSALESVRSEMVDCTPVSVVLGMRHDCFLLLPDFPSSKTHLLRNTTHRCTTYRQLPWSNKELGRPSACRGLWVAVQCCGPPFHHCALGCLSPETEYQGDGCQLAGLWTGSTKECTISAIQGLSLSYRSKPTCN